MPLSRFRVAAVAAALLAAGIPLAAVAPAAAERAPGIASAAVEASILNGTAFTEVRRVLENPRGADVWLEVHTLYPAGAFVSRLAVLSASGEVLEEAKAAAPDNTSGAPTSPLWIALAPAAEGPAPASTYGRPRDLALAVRTPPHSSVSLVVSFEEVLRPTRGQYRYALPLVGLGPTADFSFAAHVAMAAAITQLDVFAPASSQVQGVGSRSANVTLQGPLLSPSGALHLNFTLVAGGAHGAVASCMGASGGYFAYTFYPGTVDLSIEPIPKSVSFAVDFSGSMAGDRAAQAKSAFTSILQQLAPYDRFEVLRFDTTYFDLTGGFLDATADNTARAASSLQSQEAAGLTNLGAVLDKALSDLNNESGTLPMLVLLTDGEPTVGLKEPAAILALARERNLVATAIHTISLGLEAGVDILPYLSSESGGTYRLIDPEADIAAEISDFYLEVSEPLIQDLTMEFSEPAHNVTVPPVSVLYGGSDVTARGELTPPGATVYVTIEGRSSKGQFAVTDSFVPDRLPCGDLDRGLALVLLAALIARADAEGASPSLVAGITDLALEYGFATAYTPLLLASGHSVQTSLPGPPPPPAPPPAAPSTAPEFTTLGVSPIAIGLAAVAVALAALALLLRARRPKDPAAP